MEGIKLNEIKAIKRDVVAGTLRIYILGYVYMSNDVGTTMAAHGAALVETLPRAKFKSKRILRRT